VSSVVTSHSFSAADFAAFDIALKRLETPQVRWDTPGDLARALDPSTRQTPALDLIDAALLKVANGETKRLIISMPPQEGKSERTTHYGALWLLQQNPDLRIGIVSYGDDIAGQFSYKIRNDITTFDGTEDTIDIGLRLRTDSKAASRWQLRHPNKGGVYAIGIGGALTGRPVDAMFIDDPVKDFRNADSVLMSELAWQWWQSVARPRLHPDAPVVLILTRWHEADLAGRLLAKQVEDEASQLEHFDRWTVINIPAQADFDPAKGQTDPLGREPGEFMISARGRTLEQWKATQAATSSRIWSALYQGRPSPDTGDVWKRGWWRRYSTPLWKDAGDGKSYRLIEVDEALISCDFTFKDTKASDFVVMQVWARRGADVYLVDQVRKRLTFTESVTALINLVKKWPDVIAKLVEDKANGTAVIDTLHKKIPGIIAIEPRGSKYARANAVAPFIEAGNAHLPAVEIALFEVEEFIEEVTAFPNGAHDDQVDGASQAFDRLLLRVGAGSAFLQAMKSRAEAEGLTVPTTSRNWRDNVPKKPLSEGQPDEHPGRRPR
jgi:predicted phage terminase large subunit-like protein